jgi:hypothetical protein
MRRVLSIPYICLWFLLAGLGLAVVVFIVILDLCDVGVNYVTTRARV